MDIVKTKKCPTRLVEICIDELSVVDKGANAHANIVITKRDDTPPAAAPLRITKSVIEAERLVVKSDITPTRLASRKSVNFGDFGSRLTQTTEEPMTVEKAEATLDGLVANYVAKHDVSEATAMVKILETPAGKAAYRELTHAKDLQIAKCSTLLTFEKRTVEKIGGHNVDERTAVTDALEKLDAMAKAEANKTGQTYFQVYSRILATPAGRALYTVACNKPSLGGVTA